MFYLFKLLLSLGLPGIFILVWFHLGLLYATFITVLGMLYVLKRFGKVTQKQIDDYFAILELFVELVCKFGNFVKKYAIIAYNWISERVRYYAPILSKNLKSFWNMVTAKAKGIVDSVEMQK